MTNYTPLYLARDGTIVLTLLLLIYARQKDLQIDNISLTLNTLQHVVVDKTPVYKIARFPNVNLNTNKDLYDVDGSITVTGCIRWQQPLGIYQNICMLYSEVLRDCVHGVYLDSTACACAPNWRGSLCDRHTCFYRGAYDPATTTCRCFNTSYTASSMCADLAKPELLTSCIIYCQGFCVLGKCVCNKPGQIGRDCNYCASPLIDGAKCPGRTNWGLEYISTGRDNNYGICGGGYEFTAPDILIIRGLVCLDDSCQMFRQDRSICCFPNTNLICNKWFAFSYKAEQYANAVVATVFNANYRLQYLQILRDHSTFACFNESGQCLQRAYTLINTADRWPLLSIDPILNQAYYVMASNIYYLGLGPMLTATTVEAVWSNTPSAVYLKPTGTYTDRKQAAFLFYNVYPDIYCLTATAGQTVAWTTLTQRSSSVSACLNVYVNTRNISFIHDNGYTVYYLIQNRSTNKVVYDVNAKINLKVLPITNNLLIT